MVGFEESKQRRAHQEFPYIRLGKGRITISGA